MQLRHIELINAILQTGSLTRAAQLLHISQPAASKMLGHAELQLGYALFRRIRGRLQPTPELEALAPGMEKLHEDLGSLRRLAENLKRHPKGRIRVGCIPALGLGLLPPAIKTSRDHEPGIVFDVHTYHNTELIARLLVRELDLAIGFGGGDHPGIERLTIGHTELVHISSQPPGAPPAGPLALEELDGRSLIMLDVTDRAGALLEQAVLQAGIRLRSDIQVQTHYVACALAQAGCGDAVVDALTACALLRPGLMLRRFAPPVPVPVSVMHHAAMPLRDIDQTFIQVLKRTCDALSRDLNP